MSKITPPPALTQDHITEGWWAPNEAPQTPREGFEAGAKFGAAARDQQWLEMLAQQAEPKHLYICGGREHSDAPCPECEPIRTKPTSVTAQADLGPVAVVAHGYGPEKIRVRILQDLAVGTELYVKQPNAEQLNCALKMVPAGYIAAAPEETATAPSEGSRKLFETWARNCPWIKDTQKYPDDHHDKNQAGKYGHLDTQRAWEVWQAAMIAAAPQPRQSQHLSRELVRLADIHRDCGRLISKDGTAEKVMREAAAMLDGAPDQPEPQPEPSGPLVEGWQVSIADGHSGFGAYAHMTEYPEEGAVLLCAAPKQPDHQHAALPIELAGHFLRNFGGQEGRWQQCKWEMPGLSEPLFAAKRPVLAPCPDCKDEGGWEKALSSTNYTWVTCPSCKPNQEQPAQAAAKPGESNPAGGAK